jgi:hypothetical protein
MNGVYDPKWSQEEKDDTLSAFLRDSSRTLGRLGCNVHKNYSAVTSATITNTTYADLANFTAGFTTSGGACLVRAKINGNHGTAVSCYAQLYVDGVVVDESRVGSAGGLTNGNLDLEYLITEPGNHTAKVQVKVDSGTFTRYSEKFYIIETLRG